jgi:hypothetical protein
MSAVQSLFGAGAAKFLSTRSGAGMAEGSWRVVCFLLRPRMQPLSPSLRISLATRFLEQRTPRALSSAWTLG